jgi:hypothetical protein
MKNLTCILYIALIVLISSCTLKEVVNPDGTLKTGKSTTDTTGTGSGTGTGTATGTTNSTSYQPVTKNSTWKYVLTAFGGTVDNITFTMTGNVTVQNSLNYNEYSHSSPLLNTELFSFAYDNHLYISREYKSMFNDMRLVDIPYLKDDVAINGTWSGASFNPGNSGFAAQYTGKLLEKDFTKTVNNKAFTNVYHSHVDLIYSTNGGMATQTVESYDYYVAKGIGIIEVDETIAGQDAGKLTLLSYTVK